jgi:hypothetical protein
MLVLSIIASGQKINDKVNGDGSRYISTDYVKIYKSTDKYKNSILLSLMAYTDGTTIFSISMNITALVPITINDKATLLLKLSDDEIITLHALSSVEDDIGRYHSTIGSLKIR